MVNASGHSNDDSLRKSFAPEHTHANDEKQMTEAAQHSMHQLVEASECGGGGSDLWSEWVLPRFLFLHLPLRLLSQLVLHVPTTRPMLEPPSRPPRIQPCIHTATGYITLPLQPLHCHATLCCRESPGGQQAVACTAPHCGQRACVCKKKRCVIPPDCAQQKRCELNALLHRCAMYGMLRHSPTTYAARKGRQACCEEGGC